VKLASLSADTLLVGAKQEIRWSTNLSNGSVTLKYSTNGGVTYPNLIAENQINNGSYIWSVPELNTDSLRIRIEVSGAFSAVDESKSNSTVTHKATVTEITKPVVKLISPVGGEKWLAGTTYNIRWMINDNTVGVDTSIISYSNDGGKTFNQLIKKVVGKDDTLLSWPTPVNLNSDSIQLQIEVKNGQGLVGQAVTIKNLSILNSPPEILALPESHFSNTEAINFCLSDFVRDSNDNLLSLHWFAVADNKRVNVTINQDTKNCTITAEGFVGTAHIAVTVEDPQNASDTATLTIVAEGQATTGITTNPNGSIPKEYLLYQNYPNPFNPTTEIRFGLPKEHSVTLKIYNLFGQEIRILADGEELKAGYHTVVWDGKNQHGALVSSGIYFVKIEAGEFTSVKKMCLMK
jgi:hypothetical protein